MLNSVHHKSIRALLAAGAIAALAVAITACSGGGATYSSPEALKQAYVDAGGSCDNEMEVGEDMMSEGAHGIICAQPVAMLIVFDSEEAKDRYLARTGELGESDWVTYGGERWLATGEPEDVLSNLGGSEISR